MIQELLIAGALAFQAGNPGDQIEIIEVQGEQICGRESNETAESQWHLRRPGVEYCFSYAPDPASEENLASRDNPRAHLIHLIEIFPVSSVNDVRRHVDAANNRPAFPNGGAEGPRGLLGLCATGTRGQQADRPAFTIFRLDPGNGNFHRPQSDNYAVGETGGWVDARLRSGPAGGVQTHCAYITLGAGRYEVLMRMHDYEVAWFYAL